MKTMRPTLGLVTLLAIVGCGGDKPLGNEVTSTASKFSVRFPAPPKADDAIISVEMAPIAKAGRAG